MWKLRRNIKHPRDIPIKQPSIDSLGQSIPVRKSSIAIKSLNNDTFTCMYSSCAKRGEQKILVTPDNRWACLRRYLEDTYLEQYLLFKMICMRRVQMQLFLFTSIKIIDLLIKKLMPNQCVSL